MMLGLESDLLSPDTPLCIGLLKTQKGIRRNDKDWNLGERI